MQAIRLIPVIIFMLAISACRNEADAEVAAWLGTNRLNVELEMVIENEGTIRTDSAVLFTIENLSNIEIRFPPDFGLRLFAYSLSESNWIEVENRANILVGDEGWILAPQSEDPLNFTGLGAYPIIADVPDPSILRITLLGRDPNGQLVGAYVDVPYGSE